MAEAEVGEARLSPSWLRDELRRLRRLRRRFSSDPLLGRSPPRSASLTARPSVVLMGAMPKGGRLLEKTAAHRRRKEQRDMSSHLSFWKRIVGLVIITIAVILFLKWTTINPHKLPQLEPCPDDWLYYKKKCYYHSGDMEDWNSSQEFCSDYGASLAVINSRQELLETQHSVADLFAASRYNLQIFSVRWGPFTKIRCGNSVITLEGISEISKNFIMYRIRVTNFWIGLRRKGNQLFWVNGESFDTNLFHVNITNDGDCVHIDSGFISTRSCSSHRNGLCTIGTFNPKTSFY